MGRQVFFILIIQQESFAMPLSPRSPTTASSLRNLIGSSPTRLSSKVCMNVIRAIQDASDGHKGAMVSGLTAAFVMVSELTGISIPDLVVYAKNGMTDGEIRYPEYRACEDFLVNEVFN